MSSAVTGHTLPRPPLPRATALSMALCSSEEMYSITISCSGGVGRWVGGCIAGCGSTVGWWGRWVWEVVLVATSSVRGVRG